MPDMFSGATPEIFKNAESLRESQTHAEEVLWEELRNKKLGVKFRRQHPIAKYIVDFYCYKFKLVIELDGEYHNNKQQKSNDDFRTQELRSLGLKVIRFTNAEVLNNLSGVIKSIRETISS